MDDTQNLIDLDKLEENEIENEEETHGNYTFEYSLTSYGIDFDVAGLVRRYNDNRIIIPKFQRNFIWNKSQASKFIESLLLGLPVPGIFLYKNENNQKLEIIDGQQRILTLSSFYNNKFKEQKFSLTKVHNDYIGKTYAELAKSDKDKLDDTLIHTTIVQANHPENKNYESIFQIFDRLNTGGIKLRPQEVRNSIFQGEFLDLIIDLANQSQFLNLLQCDLSRKKHEEICLRLIALIYYNEKYNGNMKAFLNMFLAENRNFELIKKDEIIIIFNKILSIINDSEIRNVFRTNNGPINLAILDSVFVGLAHMIHLKIDFKIEIIASKIIIIINSEVFKNRIQTGTTHHTESVKQRLKIMKVGLETIKND